MSFGLRSIAFVAELIHPPVRHDGRTLQQIHSALFADATASYRDFRLVNGGALLSNQSGGAPGSPVSSAMLLADRIQVREEQTGVSQGDFAARLSQVARVAMSNLPLRAYLAQQYVVRAVVNLHTSLDARQFVLRHMASLDESALAPFPAEPTLGGLRFSFPPGELDQAVYNVRIESFAQDNRSVFLENVGTFAKPLDDAGLEAVTERFDATYVFLAERVVEFVAHFDAPGEGG